MQDQSIQHEGHTIEVRYRADTRELLVDGVPMRHGQLPDGRYFLADYAYDPTDDLLELGRRYVSYRRRVEEVRARERRKGA